MDKIPKQIDMNIGCQSDEEKISNKKMVMTIL